MVGFLRWSKSIALGTLNGVVKFTLFIVLLLVVLMLIGLARGDGLPGQMVLTADLRAPLADSARQGAFDFGDRPLTVMDTVLALDRASRDSRVKGLFLRVGGGGLSGGQAGEAGARGPAGEPPD